MHISITFIKSTKQICMNSFSDAYLMFVSDILCQHSIGRKQNLVLIENCKAKIPESFCISVVTNFFYTTLLEWFYYSYKRLKSLFID